MNILEKYNKVNQSYDKIFVYHLGSRSGFFSEYNYMILSLIYCLRNRIQFQLYSADLSIAHRNGWTDYFLPFCKENKSILHYLFNTRFPRLTPQFLLRKTMSPLVKKICRCHYFNFELWNHIKILKQMETIKISSMDINLPLQQTCRLFIDMTWRFNPHFNQVISQQSARANLPSDYLAVHIRSGDKIKEAAANPLSVYMQKLESISPLRDVFVMTDDYRNFQTLQKNYPKWNFYTLETPDQNGYHHRVNSRKSPEQKKADATRLLTGIELAAAARHFVGTFSSNIGLYMAMRMHQENCHAIDTEKFEIW